jgi:hypothetical protein
VVSHPQLELFHGASSRPWADTSVRNTRLVETTFLTRLRQLVTDYDLSREKFR